MNNIKRIDNSRKNDDLLRNGYSEKKDGNDKRVPTYQLIHSHKLDEGEKPLGRVIGLDNQKEELLLVIDWFKHSKDLREKGISIPKGVILFGEPGNGKSLIIREMIKCCEAPVFIFQNDTDNIAKGVSETFKKARESGHALIVLDELDLLINRDSRVIRVLQENLDGVESDDDILVLSATNDFGEIPLALLRNGRLEKIIEIPEPTDEDALKLLKKYFKEFNVELPKDFDDEEVALTLHNVSCASIKAIVNDLVLRNGFENITTEMVYNSIYNISDRVKDTPQEDNLEVAIHEAGHALVASAFPQFFSISRIDISGASGEFKYKEVEKYYWPYDKIIASIKVSMAGVLAQKIICGRGSSGCDYDLQKARIRAYNMINNCGYSSCWETLPTVSESSRRETPIKLRKMERKIELLLKKCERETAKYIKRHKTKIIELGNKLFEKKNLKSSEILSIIG